MPAPTFSIVAAVARSNVPVHVPNPSVGEARPVSVASPPIRVVDPRSTLVAALNESLLTRATRLNARQPQVSGSLVGEPEIAFDPTGHSARVAYRWEYAVDNGRGVRRAEVREQDYWAYVDGAWQPVGQ